MGLLPIIGFFTSKSVKHNTNYISNDNSLETDQSIPMHHYGNQEIFSNLKPKERKEEALPSDSRLNIDDEDSYQRNNECIKKVLVKMKNNYDLFQKYCIL